eukprot:m.48395 g.48395  ORF g.48395 m.48395 type:complete len:58 (-) comp12394_c1_seq4:1610-1783(-)
MEVKTKILCHNYVCVFRKLCRYKELMHEMDHQNGFLCVFFLTFNKAKQLVAAYMPLN